MASRTVKGSRVKIPLVVRRRVLNDLKQPANLDKSARLQSYLRIDPNDIDRPDSRFPRRPSAPISDSDCRAGAEPEDVP